MKLTGYQRKDVQEKMRKALNERIAAGHAPFFADKPKPIDPEKEAKIMRQVKYD